MFNSNWVVCWSVSWKPLTWHNHKLCPCNSGFELSDSRELPATCGFACQDKMINFRFSSCAAWLSNGKLDVDFRWLMSCYLIYYSFHGERGRTENVGNYNETYCTESSDVFYAISIKGQTSTVGSKPAISINVSANLIDQKLFLEQNEIKTKPRVSRFPPFSVGVTSPSRITKSLRYQRVGRSKKCALSSEGLINIIWVLLWALPWKPDKTLLQLSAWKALAFSFSRKLNPVESSQSNWMNRWSNIRLLSFTLVYEKCVMGIRLIVP